jgi:alkylation response protein AidB-like acyl-CoA dehydrogenase
MDFALSEEHKMFREAIRNFAQSKVAPLVDEAEENETCPVELFAELGKLGYLCPGYPPEYGGGGLGQTGTCIMVEELAKVCSGICSGLMVQSGLATYPILTHATEEQKQRFLVPAIKGEKVTAYGLTEPNGFSRTKMRKLGHHSAATGEFSFEDCRVPAQNLIGEEGRGFRYMLEALSPARISHSARSVGLAQAAFDATLNYAKERKQFGQPIGKFQAISFMLARMAIDVEAARALVHQVAWLFDQGNECRKEAPMTKAFSSDVAIRVAEQAMRIHAGAGYLAESTIQRYFRDAILYHTTEGTTEIQELIISRELGL